MKRRKRSSRRWKPDDVAAAMARFLVRCCPTLLRDRDAPLPPGNRADRRQAAAIGRSSRRRNPASLTGSTGQGLVRGLARVSYDGGNSWAVWP